MNLFRAGKIPPSPTVSSEIPVYDFETSTEKIKLSTTPFTFLSTRPTVKLEASLSSLTTVSTSSELEQIKSSPPAEPSMKSSTKPSEVFTFKSVTSRNEATHVSPNPSVSAFTVQPIIKPGALKPSSTAIAEPSSKGEATAVASTKATLSTNATSENLTNGEQRAD